jgi:PKD repeat protein
VWQWSKQFGSAAVDNGNGITTDPSGNLYVTGCFSGTVQFGSSTLISNGATEDVYVCKLDPSGNSIWAIKAGGSTPDYGNAIQRDISGNLYVTGWYSTTAAFGSSSVTTSGGNEVFVARCDPNGTWQWVASGGTPGIDIGYDIAIDNDDNSYVTGYVNAGYPVIFGSDTISIVSDFSDVFVAKCDSNGLWQWLLVNGGLSWDVGYGIVTENCSQYVTGYFSLAVNFDPILLTASGNTPDAFIGKYTHDANACASLYTSDTTVCEKFCISFFDQSVNNPISWLWLFPGGSPSSSTDQNPSGICYNDPGTFDVTLITTSASGNDTLLLQDYITVYPTPPIPVISQNGYTLTSSPATAYQWQFNNSDIPGATNQSYDAIQSGYYAVYISNENGCTSYATIYVLITGIEKGISDFNAFTYPNPSDGKITVELSYAEKQVESAIDVLNITGQKVFSSNKKITPLDSRIQIDLSGVAPGIYFIEIRSENGFVRKKIVITR